MCLHVIKSGRCLRLGQEIPVGGQFLVGVGGGMFTAHHSASLFHTTYYVISRASALTEGQPIRLEKAEKPSNQNRDLSGHQV